MASATRDAVGRATRRLHVVVLAAGRGTRMRSARPKVLQPILGQPLLDHVLRTANALAPDRITVVVGHQAGTVEAYLRQAWAPEQVGAERDVATQQPGDVHDVRSRGEPSQLLCCPVATVRQEPPRGTGHAVALALGIVPDDASVTRTDAASAGAVDASSRPTSESRVLVLYGDVPALRPSDVEGLLDDSDECAVLGAYQDDPTGYGRLLFDGDRLAAIVEERDATPEQRMIRWVNTGVLAANESALKDALTQILAQPPRNAAAEWYLTDVVAVLNRRSPGCVRWLRADEAWRADGVNDQLQRSALETRMRRATVAQWQREGLAVAAPDRVIVEGELAFGTDCVLGADVVIRGRVRLGDRVRVGQGVHLDDASIGDDATILPYSIVERAEVAAGASVGPFARLRPGARIGDGAKVGNFVEVKNATLETGAKVNHLSYVGDAEVGAHANLGAGTITCNYDGQRKSRTVIGAGAFVGSNTALVAPVTLGAGCTIAAGSVITETVPDHALAIGRARQVNKADWTPRHRRDHASAGDG